MSVFNLAKGSLFMYWCRDCQQSSGGGVINEQFTIELHQSMPCCPTKKPCIWCGKGPMVMVVGNLNLITSEKVTNSENS